jgi:type IV pilus assembly protein PilW
MSTPRLVNRRRMRGFSVVEMAVAMGLGLLLTAAAATVYISTKSTFRRQEQLSAIQQYVRMAFEYLARDARMAGHMGCFTGQDSTPVNNFDWSTDTAKFKSNYALGVEGYDFAMTDGAYTLASADPADTTATDDWRTNQDAKGTTTIPVATLAGGTDGLTPGSDVLVIRTAAGRAARLAAATTASATVQVENVAGGKCPDATDRMSGLCANSHAVIANCVRARMFPVASVSAGSVTASGGLFTSDQYVTQSSEVIPLQTVTYHVKRSSSGKGTSLYRRVFDGTVADGVEDELINGVESLQIRYGRDTTTPSPDGTVDEYVTADQVSDWTRVVTVRMSVLLRAPDPLPVGTQAPASGQVNGVTLTYPDARYDRRVFTTTVAVRNKTSFF